MKRILFFSLMIISFGITNAQYFQLHGGMVYPTGDFADNDEENDKAGYAAPGFNVGIKSYIPLSTSNFSLVFGFDFFYNGLQSKYKDEMEELFPDDNYSPSAYLNMPITVGLNYSYPLYKQLKIYGEAGLGLNYSMMTSDVIKFEEGYTTYKDAINYDNSFGFCYNLEGGFLIKWFKLGLKYNYLGNYSYKTKWSLTDEYGDEIDSEKWDNTKRAISNWQFVIGFVF